MPSLILFVFAVAAASTWPDPTLRQIDLPNLFAPLVATIMGCLLLSVLCLTVGLSLVRARNRRRRESVRERLRGGLLERLYGPENPGWAEWVDSLSERERFVLENLLEEYLRELEGADMERLRGLGPALGINDRARTRLESGDAFTRLNALTWLALLGDAPDVSILEKHCTGTARERAAATRALYVTDRENVATVGVDLLLGDSPEPFSVFGIDTLYRVAETDPGPLFARAVADYREWDPALQAQVLLVTRRLNTVVGDADLSWIVDLAASPAERTRIEAIRTLGGFGWRQSLREQVDVDALASDPSSRVRTSVYRTLGEWGDQEATDALLRTVTDETDKRARVAATQELVGNCDGDVIPESLSDAWSWATENAAFDRLARDLSASRQSVEVGDE
jgi:hypothetical protein